MSSRGRYYFSKLAPTACDQIWITKGLQCSKTSCECFLTLDFFFYNLDILNDLYNFLYEFRSPLAIFKTSVYTGYCFLLGSGPSRTFGCFCLNLLFERVFGHFYIVSYMQEMFLNFFFQLNSTSIYFFLKDLFCDASYSDCMLMILYFT